MKTASKKILIRALLVALASSVLAAAQSSTQPKGASATNEAKSGAITKKDASPPASAAGPDYIIGIDDVLAINVWHEAEMSRTVPVRPDGKISLPLLGEFEANGRTPRQLQEALSKQLSTLINNPEVTVIVEKINSLKFNIVGEVGRPGSYPLSKPMTVLDAVAVAGGLKDFARPKKMYVLRRNRDGATVRMPFNYKKAIQGSSTENFELEERDTVVVP